MLKNKILILGKIPPPIGGVTVHVSRLLKSLENKGFRTFHFSDLQRESIVTILTQISQFKVIHLHTSNPYFQLIVAIYCCLIGRKLIITYHGSWGRFGFWKNRSVELSAWLALVPILLNSESFVKAKKINKNAVIISAFIPPVNVYPLKKNLKQKLTEFRIKYQYLFCTNSWNLTFDKKGTEIYGISSLIANISQNTQSALIISDPSGTNKRYIENGIKKIPENILFICGEHDFWNILEYSNAFIRNTTTDGDSISIHEAIIQKVPVFASSCVTRPPGCRLFTNVMGVDFEQELKKATLNNMQENGHGGTIGEIISLYVKCLSL